MLEPNFDIESVFKINSSDEFNDISLKIFQFQSENNSVYNQYLSFLGIDSKNIKDYTEIPFLPIEFFKTHKVFCGSNNIEKTFKSSGTTKNNRSEHHVAKLSIYDESFLHGFKYAYGKPEDYCFLALLPNYLEQGDSSLVYMTQKLIKLSRDVDSAFYLDNYEDLNRVLRKKEREKKPTILLGVSYALIDFASEFQQDLHHTIIMETGGMKGRKREIIREELHELLSGGFGVSKIHSEYGMTELLSQAYSKGNGLFSAPPWIKVLTRSVTDPLQQSNHKSGPINIIDLANVYSCSFIATQDLGKLHKNNTFEVLGRIDNSDIRGCSLMVS